MPKPEHWYLEAIGDLVDELEVRWGHTFLRQEFAVDMTYYDRAGTENLQQIFDYDERSFETRATDEMKQGVPFWTAMNTTFPNLEQLQLHIPSAIYEGDQNFIGNFLPSSD